MKLLFVLTVTNDDSAAAEKLLDYIRTFSGKSGHLVLALMSDVHEEMKARIRISASLAFDFVHELNVLPLADRQAPKTTHFNNIFRQVSQHIAKSFEWPFLWLESTTTPTTPMWRQLIAAAYEGQPCAFFGNRMMFKPKTPEAQPIKFMAEVGVYPNNATDLMIVTPADTIPVKVSSAVRVLEKLGTTNLIQHCNLANEGDLISVRDDAIIVTGDKAGLLRAQHTSEEPVPVNRLEPDPLVATLAKRLTPVKTKNGAR